MIPEDIDDRSEDQPPERHERDAARAGEVAPGQITEKPGPAESPARDEEGRGDRTHFVGDEDRAQRQPVQKREADEAGGGSGGRQLIDRRRHRDDHDKLQDDQHRKHAGRPEHELVKRLNVVHGPRHCAGEGEPAGHPAEHPVHEAGLQRGRRGIRRSDGIIRIVFRHGNSPSITCDISTIHQNPVFPNRNRIAAGKRTDFFQFFSESFLADRV